MLNHFRYLTFCLQYITLYPFFRLNVFLFSSNKNISSKNLVFLLGQTVNKPQKIFLGFAHIIRKNEIIKTENISFEEMEE